LLGFLTVEILSPIQPFRAGASDPREPVPFPPAGPLSLKRREAMSEHPAVVDWAEFDREVDEFVNLIKKVPCGRTRRLSQYTLYQDIARQKHVTSNQPLSPEELRTIIVVLLSFKPMEVYTNTLLEFNRELKNERLRIKPEEEFQSQFLEEPLAAFIWHLALECPDELKAITFKVNEQWRGELYKCFGKINVGVQTYISQVKERTLLDQHMKRVVDKLEREGITEGWTNLPKIAVKSVAQELCRILREKTGRPQNGIVGQLLLHAKFVSTDGMPEEDVYSRLTQRVKDLTRGTM